jgi:predicted phosphoribosyltransferase
MIMNTHERERHESWPIYDDRTDAGLRLAGHLAPLRGRDLLVLGIPRGGVAVAAVVAEELEAELDIVAARKVGAPHHGELAIGAVTANGGVYLDEELIAERRVPSVYLDVAVTRERVEARRQERSFRDGRPAPPIEGRTVIVVDDGWATGATVRAAARSVRKHRPARLILAAPVGSIEAARALAAEADDLVCPEMPDPFWSVATYYVDFPQMTDEAVRRILSDCAAHPSSATPEVVGAAIR